MIEWTLGNVFVKQVTLNASNLTLNSASAQYFKDYRWVMVGLDRDCCQVAIKGVGKQELDLQLIPQEHLHKISVGKGYARIANKSLILDIVSMMHEDVIGKKFEAYFDEVNSMLMIDLRKSG